MSFKDLRDFIGLLEQKGELKRISTEGDPCLAVTAISDRTLRAGGPALLFENPKGSTSPAIMGYSFQIIAGAGWLRRQSEVKVRSASPVRKWLHLVSVTRR